MRIEIIEEEYAHRLENRVNGLLSVCNPSDIIDIKYSDSGAATAHSSKRFSVMIIFR